MTTYVLRVWVPDRPGALGAVASRIGAVRGDLVGIDILERGAGRAIDELLVELPDELVPLLIAEVSQVDGVDVEDVRPAPDWPADPRLDALETAAVLVGQQSVASLLDALAFHVSSDFQTDWAAIVDLDVPVPVVSVGSPLPGRGSGRSWPGAGRRSRRPRSSAVPTTWPGPSWRQPNWCSFSAGGDDRSEPASGGSWPPWPASPAPAGPSW